MPGETRDLRVRWIGDATSLVKSSKTAEGAVTSSGKKIEGAGASLGGKFSKLSSVLGTFGVPFSGSLGTASKDVGALESSGLGMGGAMGGAVTAGLAVAAGAAIAFGKQPVEAAAEFDHAHEQLQTVVENTGAAVAGWAGKVDGADRKMISLGFTSTETETALGKLVPVTHSVQGATSLLGTAADLARARNESLGTATQTLVAIEAGRMKGLAQLGIATKDATGKTISAKQAVQEITDLYRGSASQYAQTYAGQIAVLKANLNDLKVQIGNALMPTLSVLATEGSAALGALDAGAHHLGTSVGGVVAGVLTLGGSVLLHAWQSQHKGAEDAADAVKNLKKAQQDYANDLAAGDTTSQKALDDRKAYSDAQTKAAAMTKGLTDATTSATGATAAQTAAEAAATKAAKAREQEEQKETDAILGTRDANIALSNATLGVSDSLQSYNEKALTAAASGGKNAQANRDWEKASNDVKSAIDGVASSAKDQATQQAALHGKTLDARDSADAQRTALEKLRTTIAPGNPFRTYLDSLIRDLDTAAKPRTGTLAIQVLAQTPTGPITFNPNTGVYHAPGVTRFAEGGYVPGPIGSPLPAIVHGGEYVTRAQDVGRVGGGVVNHYAISVHVAPGADPAATGKAVVDAIRAYERRNEELAGGVIDTLWSEWAEVRVLLAIGASSGADPVFTLDDPTYGQLDVGVLGSPLAPYVDVTCDVRAIDYGWGATRNDGVLTRWEAASGSLVLDNNEGAYDVGTDDSPLVPMIGVLVQARLVGSSSWVTRFAGFANAFAAGWDAGSLDATTTISATDATGLLAAYVMQPTSPLVGAGDTSSQRVGRILDAAEWTGARDLDSGGRVLAATDLSGDAWSQLLAVDDAELGAVYIAPDGTATFRTREHVWGQITATSAPSVTFGPGVGQLRYEDATVSSDDALLRNIVDAQRPGGALVSVRDAASVSRFRPHRYANTGLALASDSDVQSWASMVLNVSSAPFSRVDALVVIPRTDPAHLFPVVLGAQYLDRWHVVVDPPGNADEIERDVLVRGWHTTIDRTDWQTTYALSSLAGFDAFILDDPDTMLDVVRLTAWGHAMPWKQWAYLERVTSPDFQSYLQNQTVPQFVNVAQRDSVWTPVPPPKGATCVTQDTLTRWIWDGAQWVAATQPRGIVASGIAGQPAVNGLLNLSTVVAGPASWLAGHTVTLPAGSAGLYLISLVAYFRSSAIVGMRLEITNSAAASYAPNMLVAESTNPSTWDPNTMAGAWVRPCGDGDTFRVTNRGNAETAPDYVQTARLSIVRLGDSLAPY